MPGLADVFDQLGQTVIPQIAAAAFPDTCDIVEDTRTVDSQGGQVTVTSTEYNDVPCAYEPRAGEFRTQRGDKMVSVQEYLVTIPTHDSTGDRINLDVARMRIVVNARGNEPSKTFRPIAVKDSSGVVFEVICTREDAQ